MSTAVSNTEHAELVIQTVSSRTPSVERLVQRLSAEVDGAQKHVHSLQTEAEGIFHGQEDRLMRFITVADRIQAILLPRLQTFEVDPNRWTADWVE